MQLLIRADASTQIGTGHVMRCLALAQAWESPVTFLCHETIPAGLRQRLEDEGMTVQIIDTEIGGADDLKTTINLAKALDAVLVVDGYHFGAEYQRELKAEGLKFLFIDDNGHAAHYYADWVLNQNIHAHEELYRNREPYTQLLCGLPYVLLRREFWKWRGTRREIPDTARKVLVTLGGSDPDNMTTFVIRELDRVAAPLEVTVVVGGGSPYYETVLKAAQESVHRVQVEWQVTDMPTLMAGVDLAICTASTTVWEMMFMGVPTLTLVTAENQRQIAQVLDQQRLTVYIQYLAELVPKAAALLENQEQRQHMSLTGQALVDGRGTQRIVNRITGRSEALALRPVTIEDAALIWVWANDRGTRDNSFNTAPIPWEAHLAWYGRQIASPEIRFWFLEASGIPVAHIRFQRQADNTALIGYTVGPQYRGKGYGTAILELSKQLTCHALGVQSLKGITLAFNIASQRAFEKAGYTLVDSPVIEGRPCFVFEWSCEHV